MTDPPPAGPADRESLDDLRARIAALEAETRRAFDDAQREADTLFAQYQLSQLLASGGGPAQLGEGVVVELLRLAGAVAGAIWLGETGRSELLRIAISGTFADTPPVRFEGIEAARAWARRQDGVTLLVLGDDTPATVTALRGGSRGLDEDGLRIAQLARHEIAVAFGGARLREALEQERSELSAVVDGATDVIVQVDSERRVTRLNPAGARKLGISATEAAGRRCDELFGCSAVAGHDFEACPFFGVLTSGEPIDFVDMTIAGVGGTPIRVAGSYFRSQGDAPDTRATGILRDVTALRALETLREGFVATVSHELRTPLALIRGYAETVLHLELEPAEQREYVERIHGVSDRLKDLVDQILDVTHLDADPLFLERSPVAFSSLVARLRGDLVLSGEDARLVARLPSDLPPIEVDAGRIGRVLDNLVGNALKYAPGTPVVVGATVDGEWLTVTVDDEGIGIPDADRTLVTEPFHRAWNVRESRIPGTGLGLYICRRLVEAHGGRLSIHDRPDGRPGTRVAFTVPILPDERRRSGKTGSAAVVRG